MVMWVESSSRRYGLEQEPGWESSDPRGVKFQMDEKLKMEVVQPTVRRSSSVASQSRLNRSADSNSGNRSEIRFLPDGTISETSLAAVKLLDQEGIARWLVQGTNHLDYDLASQYDETR